jgi:hypothetical protein
VAVSGRKKRLTVSSEERVSQKAVQIMAGALMLLVWGIWGASAMI